MVLFRVHQSDVRVRRDQRLVVATLGLLLWDRFAVVARATTMQVRNHDYVSAAWCAGASTPHILIREILPNIASHLAVVATLEMALAILLEAALSFLGLGVPPRGGPRVEITDGAGDLLYEAPASDRPFGHPGRVRPVRVTAIGVDR